MIRFAALALVSITSIRCDVTDKQSDGDDWETGGSSEAPPSLFGEGETGGSGGDGGSGGGSGGASGSEAGGSDGLDPANDEDGDGVATWNDCDDTDPDSSVLATDADCDSILDDDEPATDSDDDGTPDYLDTDADGDGIGDIFEAGDTDPDTAPVDSDEDGVPDYLDEDSDGDGISDTMESGVDDPTEEPRDTDGDGRYDFADTDSDGDAVPDWDEVNIHGTDAYDADTDGDDFPDGAEIATGTDPLDEESVAEGLYIEVPSDSESVETFGFEIDIQMGDVAFLLDTTASMSSTANAMASEFSAIVTSLSTVIPDAEYGFATFDDYAFGSYGSAYSGDKPFILLQQITDNREAVQATLSSVPIHSGGDGPESAMEALYQASRGAGYDQNCNGAYDATTDVLPFLATSEDPFTGSAGQSYSAVSTGGGLRGGFGFRDYALPVVVYATDNELRDPEAGYGTPGGCPMDAGQSDVVEAINELGGYVIGINTNSWAGAATATEQMEALASATGSMADTDGDGLADDPLVFTWSGSSATFRETITAAIEDLVYSLKFSRVELQIEGDEWGFVSGIAPPYYENVEPAEMGGEVLDFSIQLEGAVEATTESQVYALTLNVIGDETIRLYTLDMVILVPGIHE